MNGPTGLDYCALREVWQRLKVAPRDRDEVFGDVQEMERVALGEIHRKKE